MNLTQTIRTAVIAIENVGPGHISIQESYNQVKDALNERNLGSNCHIGRKDLKDDEIVEWYAGQFLEIIDKQAWFAMNSFINCLDKFAPEISP